MEYAIDCGINIFNAAEIYPVLPKSETQGRAESIISTWLAPEKRDKVLIATKIAGRNTFDCLRRDRSPTRQSRSQIREVVDASLKRPKTDYIDLYQLHWPDRSMRVFHGLEYVHTTLTPSHRSSTRWLLREAKVCFVASRARCPGANDLPQGRRRSWPAAHRLDSERLQSRQPHL